MKFLRAISIQTRLTLIVSGVILGLAIMVGVNLSAQYDELYDQQKVKIKALVDNAYSVIEAHHKLHLDGVVSEEQARESALTEIRRLRYEDNNYFWVNDYQPIMLMHPFKPELEGKMLRDVKDPDGTPLFLNMVNAVKTHGEGFLPYKWPKPGADEPVDKISYVKGFEPWGLIVGSGIYVDNVDAIFGRILTTTLIMAAIVIALVAGFVFFTGRSILVPTHRVSLLMENIAEGEGDLTKRLEVEGHDEISGLSNNFNVFSEKMRCSLSNLSESATHVMDYAEELSQTSEAVNTATQLQNDASTQVAAAMEQMSVNVKEVSGNADSTTRRLQ